MVESRTSRGGGHLRDGFVGHRHFRGHSHGHFGTSVVIGSFWGPWWDPWWGPWYPYRPYPYSYYPGSTVIIRQQPQQYIDQESQLEQEEYWYYCRDPEGYYPYVKRCNLKWEKVAPTPPPEDEEE
jgi:hypothetical protein